jgi:hypothetical protein
MGSQMNRAQLTIKRGNFSVSLNEAGRQRLK